MGTCCICFFYSPDSHKLELPSICWLHIITYVGPVDSNKTVILDKTAVLMVTKGVYSAMKIIPKDAFGNKAIIEEASVHLEIRKVSVSGRGGLCKSWTLDWTGLWTGLWTQCILALPS